MLLPLTCVRCGVSGPALCRTCREQLPAAPLAEAAPSGLGGLAALTAYEGAGRELVVALKFRDGRRVVPLLGAALARLAVVRGLGEPDAVTWVPTTGARQRARGYDQAELLARATARALGVPARRLLRRRQGGSQTGRSRSERLRGPLLVPTWGLPVRPPRGSVLVVDDVVTTGASLGAAAAVLRAVGVGRVDAVVVAQTPLGRPAFGHPGRVDGEPLPCDGGVPGGVRGASTSRPPRRVGA